MSHRQRAEIDNQRQFAESLHAKNLVIAEALHPLNSYQAVVDTHAMECVTDAVDTIRRVNEQFAKLVGSTPDDLVGNSYASLDAPVLTLRHSLGSATSRRRAPPKTAV